MRKHLHAAKERGGLLLAAAIVAGLVLFLGAQQKGAFSSVEVKFADASASGLAIVPASCPSSPHAPANCDPGTPTNPGLGCILTASPYTIQNGQSSTLSWQVRDPSLEGWGYEYRGGTITPGVGSVGMTGSAAVSPSVSTQYVLTANIKTWHPLLPWMTTSEQAVTCDATVTVVGGEPPTPPDYCPDIPGNQQSVNDCPNNPDYCPDLPGRQSSPNDCPGGTDYCPDLPGRQSSPAECPGTCPPGYSWNGSSCVYSACPANSYWDGTRCVMTSCPAGQFLHNGTCYGSCPLPYVSGPGGQCVHCTTQNYCLNGTTLVNYCTQNTETCSYICAAGACVAPPPPSVVLWRVAPTLVRAPGTTQITWDVDYVRSCTVTGDNGDSWSGTSGSQRSSGLTRRTVFTLTCTGLDNSTVTLSETVNIVPIFDEQ